MLNMGSGGSPKFCTENWGSCTFWGIRNKTIIIMMILTKEVENFLNPPISGCFWEHFYI